MTLNFRRWEFLALEKWGYIDSQHQQEKNKAPRAN